MTGDRICDRGQQCIHHIDAERIETVGTIQTNLHDALAALFDDDA